MDTLYLDKDAPRCADKERGSPRRWQKYGESKREPESRLLTLRLQTKKSKSICRAKEDGKSDAESEIV